MLKRISWFVILFSLVFASSAQAAKVISVGTENSTQKWWIGLVLRHIEFY